MLAKIQFPSKYLQGVGALGELPAIVNFFGGNGLILASASGLKIIAAESDKFPDLGKIAVEKFGGECSEKEVARISAVVSARGVKVLVGMGGGKSIDTAKIVADKAGIPAVVVPTIASTDAPCSGCAILYSESGVFESVYYQKANPDVVLVDTAVVAQSPSRFLVAGMGDALSTWFEARSCARTASMNACGGAGTTTGLGIARLCYDTLLKYGVAAKTAADLHIVTPALEHIVEANILLSGVGFESGGLASAHAIHNGLTALEPTHKYYHGEKVAIGTLAGLVLTDADPAETDAVYSFCESIGLPTILADIGLGGYDAAKLLPAAEKACAKGEAIHNEAGEITPEKVLNALLAADAIGRRRKGKLAAAPI
jgi:glycerol dehydrogenase